jgi:preprotein translocase subunit SecE
MSSTGSAKDTAMAKAVAASANPDWKEQPRRFLAFLKDVRSEMRKVVTPSRAEVRTTTTVVIITVFFFAAYFAVVDKVIGGAIETLLSKLIKH